MGIQIQKNNEAPLGPETKGEENGEEVSPTHRTLGSGSNSWLQQIADGTPFGIRAEWARARRRDTPRRNGPLPSMRSDDDDDDDDDEIAVSCPSWVGSEPGPKMDLL